MPDQPPYSSIPPAVSVQLLVAELRLAGCRSLKEKRGRLGGLRERFGKSTGLAVAETAHPDRHDLAQWSFVAVGSDARTAEQSLARVAEFLAERVDAELISLERYNLN